MNIKRKCQFLLDKEPNRADAKLRFRVKWEGTKNIVSFGVGYRVDVAKWSTETQRCKNSTTHGKDKTQANIINAEIQRFDVLADKVFAFFEKAETTPTEIEFRSEFNRLLGKRKNITPAAAKQFFDVFDEFTNIVGVQNSWSKATYTKFGAIRKHLKHFAPELNFAEITDDFLYRFIAYMQTPAAMQITLPNSSTGLRNTTISNNLSFVRWFLRWAFSKGYYKGNSHETFLPKLKGVDGNNAEVIHLTWDELIHLFNYDFAGAKKVLQNGTEEQLSPESRKALEQVRDVFCFCCFTSLRYSDIFKLRRSDVKEKHISVVTQKTIDGLKIELNKYAAALIAKYENIHFPDDKVFPVISNQKMNEQLKTLGELIGLDDPQRIVYFIGNTRIEEVHPKWALLTTHCGRRTFIVNSFFLGIPAEVVMKWTGHTDYKTMKPYIKIVDVLKEQEMKKFDR